MKLPRYLFAVVGGLLTTSTLIPSASAAEPVSTKNYDGMNTWFPYSERPFADIAHCPSIGVAVDGSSIPVTDFTRTWATGSSASYTDPHQTWSHQLHVNGTYNLQFNGQAVVDVPYSGPITISGQSWNPTTNVTTATVTVAYPDDTLVPKTFRLRFTNTKRTSVSAAGTGISGASLTYPSSVTVDSPTLPVYGSDYPVIDANGYPLADFTGSFLTDSNASVAGTYKLIFNGQATVVPQWGGISITNSTYTAGTNTTTADVNIPVGITGVYLKFNAAHGVSNMRLFRPGYPTDGSVTFSTEYKTVMAKTDAIRFMDWGVTNTNPSVAWSDRAVPIGMWNHPVVGVDANGIPQFGSNGVPYELMVKICNEISSDLYICVPVRANDAYITNLANLIKYGSNGVTPYTSTQASPVWPPLNSNLKVYLEYGNEIWNAGTPGFYDFGWVRNIAEGQLNSATNYPIKYDGTTNLDQLGYRYTAYRATQISSLFRTVFGDSAMPGTSANPRIRPLFESQLGNSGAQFSSGLKFLEQFYGSTSASTPANPFNTVARPVSYYLYGGGGSAYYSISGVSGSSSSDPAVVFSPGPGHYVPAGYAPVVYLDSLWARNFGLKRVAYEGGMGLPENSANWTDAQMWVVNNDSRMIGVEQEFHDAFSQAGGSLLMYYTHGTVGNWGFTQAFNNFTTGKLLGLDAIRSATRSGIVTQASVIQGSATTPVTVTVPIASLGTAPSHIVQQGYTFSSTTPELLLNGIDPGEWIAFGVDAPVAATYTSVLRYMKYNTASSTVEVSINGDPTTKQTIVVPGTNGAMGTQQFSIALPAGFSAVRIKCTAGGIALASESFTLADVTSGLVGRWNFDSNTTDTSSGGTVADSGTLVGTGGSYVSGPNAAVGTAALSLNGTGSYVSVPSSTDVNLTTGCTLSAWVKLASATDNSYRMLISKKITYTDTTGYEFFYHPVLHQLLLRSGGSTSYSLSLPLTLDTNWHHLAVTINGSTAVFYLDGVVQTGATGTVANPMSGTQTLTIGRRSGTTDYPWNGQLDDVRIYNRALTLAEITSVYYQEQ